MSTPHITNAAPALRAVIIAVVVLTAALAALAAPARAASPAGTAGVYVGSGKPDLVAGFERRLGRPLHRVHDFLPMDSWSSMTDVRWWLERWMPSAYARRVVYSVPMLPTSGGTLAQGAAGAYNEHFRTLALRLVAGGDGAATLRVGWEFNGDWFPWTIAAPNGAADYAAYWRQIVTTMRSVAGASFKYDWSPNNGSAKVAGRQLDAAAAWPGDAYVDYVGMDVYDQSWISNRTDPAARWVEFMTRKDGLQWQRSFAAAHGKQLTYPEWGVAHRADGYGGGDEPYFIERMYEWIRTNNVAYHLYFDYADVIDSRLFSGRSPRAAQRYVELFGAGSDGRPLAAQPGGAPTRAADRGAGGLSATKLSIARARIVRGTPRLDLLAPITRRASGSAKVQLHAGGRRTSFSARIDSKRGRLKINRQISRRQARVGSGIVTISYDGNARTRPQEVRLRAASRHAALKARRPTISDDRLRSSGTIARAARGVVRLQLVYDVDGRSITRKFRAKIRNGRWSLSSKLSTAVRDEIARRAGSVHSYILFTGYAPRQIGGEMKSYQVLGAR